MQAAFRRVTAPLPKGKVPRRAARRRRFGSGRRTASSARPDSTSVPLLLVQGAVFYHSRQRAGRRIYSSGGRGWVAERTDPFDPARASVLQSAEAPIAGGEVLEGLEQFRATEVRPARLRDPELRVTDLPEQEIADAHLACRADHKVRVDHAGRVEMRCDQVLADVVGVRLTGLDLSRDLADGVDDFRTGAVVQRQAQSHAGVVPAEVD